MASFKSYIKFPGGTVDPANYDVSKNGGFMWFIHVYSFKNRDLTNKKWWSHIWDYKIS